MKAKEKKSLGEEILRALSEREKSFRTYPNLGKFVIQQNEIQSLLTAIILIRTVSGGLVNKKLIEWLEGSTLGNLIKIYQLCIRRKEVDLLMDFKNYNSRRKGLIHKIKKVNRGNINKYTEETLKLGDRIEKKLHGLILKKS